MPEGASYINQLTPATPTGTAPVAEGDDELRQLKQVLQNTFPDVAGMAMPVNGLLSPAHDDSIAFTVSEADARHAVLRITGALTAARDVILPTSRAKFYLVINATTGGFAITVRTAAGGGVTVAPGTGEIVYCNGVDVASPGIPSLGLPNTFTGAQAAPSILLGAATGGDQGAGSANAEGYFQNGVAFPAPDEILTEERGDFTPIVAGGTSAGSGTYSIQRGRYSLSGNRVTSDIHLNYSGHTGTGVMLIKGLPFTSAIHVDATCAVYVSDLTLDVGKVACARVTRGSAAINMYQTPVGGGSGSLVGMDAAAELALSVTYEIA